jgi:3',5'-cyclic AMP phosphodiesterase CpdA
VENLYKEKSMSKFLLKTDKKRYMLLSIVLFLFICVGSIYSGNVTTSYPERIILNVTAQPATSQAVTWRTQVAVIAPQAQIVAATASPDLVKGAVCVPAITDTLSIDGQTMYYHAVLFDTLTPNTVYAYRVGDGTVWSEWNQFQTAEANDAPFQFVYLGDPQNSILSICSRVFRMAYQKAPAARFWLMTGDLVNNGENDGEWEQLFDAFGWIARVTSIMPLPGNHEYNEMKTSGDTTRHLTPLWRPQFSLPDNGPPGLEETVYYIDCQNTRFIALNGNEQSEIQAEWLTKVLSDNPNRWTIVSMHQPLYSSAKNRDNVHLQKLFLPIFDNYGVDLVLQGHDHCYSRTYKLRAGKVVAEKSRGTVYVVSVSGPKIYTLNPLYQSLMAKMDSGKQLFQVISINKKRLSYEAWTASGELFDTFELSK